MPFTVVDGAMEDCSSPLGSPQPGPRPEIDRSAIAGHRVLEIFDENRDYRVAKGALQAIPTWNRVWVNTGYGEVVYDRAANSFDEPLPGHDSGVPSRLARMYLGKDGKIWFQSFGRVGRFVQNGHGFAEQDIPSLFEIPITSLFPARDARRGHGRSFLILRGLAPARLSTRTGMERYGSRVTATMLPFMTKQPRPGASLGSSTICPGSPGGRRCPEVSLSKRCTRTEPARCSSEPARA
jgi:hypothetical protein